MKSKERTYIYILKGMAIFSVVCAHSVPIRANDNLKAQMFSELLNYIGTMGVPMFFLLSGYLFAKNTRTFKDFWKRKLYSIVVPWLFWETLLWFYVVLRKGGAGIKQWILFIVGYGHTTYYLSVLMVLYLLFWILKKDWQIHVLMVVSLFSIISTGWNMGISGLNQLMGNYYLNFLNWLVFFAIGIILSEKEWMETFRATISKRVFAFSLVISCCYFFSCVAFGVDIWYFSKYSLIAHSTNIIMLFGLAGLLETMKNDWALRVISKIGKYSFSIYLLHQFLVGAVVAATNKIGFACLILMRPFVVIGGVMLGIWLLGRVFKSNRLIPVLLGIR